MSSYDSVSRNDNASFVNYEVNNPYEYQMIKKNKKIHNVCKNKMYKHCHNLVKDYIVLPKSNYNSNIFGGSQNYVEFDLNNVKLNDHSFFKFVLNYTLKNTTGDDAWLLLAPLQIDHITLLVNSNACGSDITDQNLLWYNLNENSLIDGQSYDNKNYAMFNNLNCVSTDWSTVSGQQNMGDVINNIALNGNSSVSYKIGIPINLMDSNFVSGLIKDNLTLRVYFKKNISFPKPTGNQVSDQSLEISNLKLYCRMREMTNSQITSVFKQPKFSHTFTKPLVNKYIVNQLIAGQEQSVILSGYNSVCSGMFVYFTSPIEMAPVLNLNPPALAYNYLFPIDKVYLTNSTGINLCNGNQYDHKYNSYLLQEHFPVFSFVLNKLCYGGYNSGHVYYIPFSADGNERYFEHNYTGGVSISENSKLLFTSQVSVNTSLVLNVVFLTPSMVELQNGSLNEYLS